MILCLMSDLNTTIHIRISTSSTVQYPPKCNIAVLTAFNLTSNSFSFGLYCQF